MENKKMNIKIEEGDYSPRIKEYMKKMDKFVTIREIESNVNDKTPQITRSRIGAVLRALSKSGMAVKKLKTKREGFMMVDEWRLI